MFVLLIASVRCLTGSPLLPELLVDWWIRDAVGRRQSINTCCASGFCDRLDGSFRKERAHLRKMQSSALFAKAPIGNPCPQTYQMRMTQSVTGLTHRALVIDPGG